MADLDHLRRPLGGDIGTTVVLTSVICTIISSVSMYIAEGRTDPANTGGHGHMITGHDDGRAVFWYLCVSSIALSSSMIIEHTYILLAVGPRAIFTQHIPPSISGRRTFYLTLTCYWVFFVGGQASLIIGMIKVRHGMLPKTFTYANVSMFVVQLSTLLLHMSANRIRSRLLGIVRINGLSSIVQSEDFDSDCFICLETLGTGGSIRSLPCEHKFHQMCVDEWLLRNPSCPLCRWSI